MARKARGGGALRGQSLRPVVATVTPRPIIVSPPIPPTRERQRGERAKEPEHTATLVPLVRKDGGYRRVERAKDRGEGRQGRVAGRPKAVKWSAPMKLVISLMRSSRRVRTVIDQAVCAPAASSWR